MIRGLVVLHAVDGKVDRKANEERLERFGRGKARIGIAEVFQKILVSDFDGTVTRFDFYRLVVDRLVPPHRGGVDYWAEYRAGRMTHFDALNAVFQTAEPGEPGLIETARAMGPDPDLRSGVDVLRSKGWDVVIASAGCQWYIKKLLDAAGVSLEVHSNPGSIVDGRLVMTRDPASSIHSAETGIDKAAVVRNAMAIANQVAFAGDGYPDLPAALLVAPEYRFATAALAEELERRGEPFLQFERWRDVARSLCDRG